jgi:acetyl-CoA acetyltransferase
MSDIYFASGVRTPFSKVDDALAAYDAIELSVPVVQAMAARLKAGVRPDLAVWGSVVPNLGWSNIAREIWLDAKLDPTVPAYSVVLACASSVTAAIAAGGMLEEGVRDLARRFASMGRPLRLVHRRLRGCAFSEPAVARPSPGMGLARLAANPRGAGIP